MALSGPDPRLHAHVSAYCGYSETAPSASRRLKIPSGKVTLILGFGPPLRITYPGHAGRASEQLSSFVVGLHDRHAVVEAPGSQEGVQIDLMPLAARTLLGVPMHTLSNRVIDLDDLTASFWPHLTERLQAIPSWAERFHWLDSLIATRLGGALGPSTAATRAWRRLSETGGQLRTAALARELGSSRQYLCNRFHEELGLSPKTLSRVLRLQHALERLERHGETRLAEIAQAAGYYDQAHFNRDFRDFTGSTPTEFLARRLPDGAGVVSD
jgi:AraC-like DNA-binding protein